MTLAVILCTLAIVLWATSNFIDKLLLSRLASESSVSVLMVFSGLIGAVSAPVYFLFDNSVLSVSPQTALLLFIVGLLNSIAIWCYLKALNDEDASTVMPLILTVPIFIFIISFFVLGETITLHQALLSLVIIVGGALLTWDIHAKKIKWLLIFWMCLACLFWSLYTVGFKYFALEDGFFVTGFWQSLSLLAMGISFFCIPKIRAQFLTYVRSAGTKIFSLNMFNEVITLVGNAFYMYAGLLIPLALLSLTQVYQTAVVFLLGLFLTFFFPHLIKEDIRPAILLQKGVSLAIMAVASYFLFT